MGVVSTIREGHTMGIRIMDISILIRKKGFIKESITGERMKL
jgi:hypothetical protein